jgi:hypothetical protein
MCVATIYFVMNCSIALFASVIWSLFYTTFATNNRILHGCLGMGAVTSWIHELKWYSGCHACSACAYEWAHYVAFALLCFDLYRPVIDADLDNIHHLQLRLWMFELAFFTDVFFFS